MRILHKTGRNQAGIHRLEDFCSILLQGFLVEHDAEAGRVVEIEDAFFDAWLAIVDFEPERIAVRIGERFEDVAIGIDASRWPCSTGS